MLFHRKKEKSNFAHYYTILLVNYADASEPYVNIYIYFGKLHWHPLLFKKLDSLHSILGKWHSTPKFAK